MPAKVRASPGYSPVSRVSSSSPDSAALSLVTRTDRSTPLGDIVDAIESEGARSDGPPLLEVARELIALGFLDGPDFHAAAP